MRSPSYKHGVVTETPRLLSFFSVQRARSLAGYFRRFSAASLTKARVRLGEYMGLQRWSPPNWLSRDALPASLLVSFRVCEHPSTNRRCGNPHREREVFECVVLEKEGYSCRSFFESEYLERTTDDLCSELWFSLMRRRDILGKNTIVILSLLQWVTKIP